MSRRRGRSSSQGGTGRLRACAGSAPDHGYRLAGRGATRQRTRLLARLRAPLLARRTFGRRLSLARRPLTLTLRTRFREPGLARRRLYHLLLFGCASGGSSHVRLVPLLRSGQGAREGGSEGS